MKETHNPHDNFFHDVFSEKDNLRDLLLNSLPGKITRLLDLDSIEVISKSFVDRGQAVSRVADTGGAQPGRVAGGHPAPGARCGQAAYQADFLIRLKHRKSPLLIYILVVRKSHPDKWTTFQMLKHMVCIWEKEIAQNSSINRLTPIIPLIFYHGEKKWSHPLDFSACFTRGDE